MFALSRVSSVFRCPLTDSVGVLKWAKTFLQPPPPVEVHQVKELFVPWVGHDHWSLLVFQYDKIVHLDSAEDDKYHKPDTNDKPLVQWISNAWQILRGVEPYEVPIVKLEVLRQSGHYECGHHTIRNTIVYLKVRLA